VDTAGNISRIVETLKDVEESNTRDDMGTYRCRWVKAKDLADQLRLFFDTLPLGRDAAGGSPKSGDQYGRGGYDPWNDPRNDPRGGGRSVGRLKSVAITVDERTNSLTITAPPEKLMLARKLIEELDKPAKPGDPPITLPDPVLKRYSVPPGTADEMAKTLQKEHPSLRVLAVPNQNEILVLGTPAEHLLVDIAVGTKKKESEKK
jgi:hypothetical protein